VWWTGEAGTGRWGWAARTLAAVTGKAFFYVGWIPALAGLWGFRARFRSSPGAWLGPLVCAPLAAALYLLAARMGYLSDRHTMLIVLCAAPWAVAGVLEAARRLADINPSWRAKAGLISTAMLLLLVGAPLVRTLQPLHADRAGFREAGGWIAKNVPSNEPVFDPYGWAAYYGGRCFRTDYNNEAPLRSDYRYVVVDDGEHSHLITVALAKKMADEGKEVWHVSGRHKKAALVRVFAVNGR
jgi:hypothetical protein